MKYMNAPGGLVANKRSEAKQPIPQPSTKVGITTYIIRFVMFRLCNNSRLDPGQYLVVVPHVHQYLRVALDGIVQDAERAGLEVRRRSRSRWCRFRHGWLTCVGGVWWENKCVVFSVFFCFACGLVRGARLCARNSKTPAAMTNQNSRLKQDSRLDLIHSSALSTY